MCTPVCETALVDGGVERLAHDAAVVLEEAALPHVGPGPGEPRPNVPAASASVSEANRHAAPVPIGRLLGRKGRSTTTPPAATSATGTP